jgi:hypothetical protein
MVISRLTTKNRRPKQNIGNFSSCKMETSFRYNSLSILRTPFEKKNERLIQKKQFIA